MAKVNQLFIAAFCFAILSCVDDIDSEIKSNSDFKYDYSSVFVSASQSSLFANLSEYSCIRPEPVTKSDEPVVSLESLLDYNNIKEYSFKNKVFHQIPFRQNRERVVASISDTSAVSSNRPLTTEMRTFLIVVNSNTAISEYVATMITSPRYFSGFEGFDYLHKSNYTGYILYSKLDGSIVEVRRYIEGRVIDCRILLPSEIHDNHHYSYSYINFYAEGIVTKGSDPEVDGGELIASICVAESKKEWWEGDDWLNGEWNNPENNGIGNVSGGGSGNGNSNGGNSNGDDSSPSDLFIDKLECHVQLSSNIPEYVTMLGSGTYEPGSTVSIDYLLNYLITEVSFSRWTGDFFAYKTATFSFEVNKDIISTAYFDDLSPCEDRGKSVINPLVNMRIAPSGGWNYKGGTFGKTRNGGKRMHTGTDLEAVPGTPLYAMYSGKIYSLKTNSPNKNCSGSYGNEIVIESTINGEVRYFQYSHLQYRTPVAVNPRTWEIFKVGDDVYSGDLIGYSGKTGNAFDDVIVPVKHLHLGVSTNWNKYSYKNNNWIDPAPYINGSIDTTKIMITEGSIDNIKCD